MSRRVWLGAGAVGVAALAGAGTALYRTAPTFWRQYVQEWSRPIKTPRHRPDPRRWPDRGLHAAWLGHSTVLLKIDGYTILTDPVFSDRAGIGLGLITLGVKRVVAPALAIDALPPIDMILLSHAHMDHFDIPSLRALENPRTEVITAWGTSDLLRAERYACVRELRWEESASAAHVNLRAVEVNHWGARMRTDTWRGYNGYVIEAGNYRVLFAGDTAGTSLFQRLASARGFDLGIMPIGAYNPWIRYHCTPEQAWRMGNDARADLLMPVHHQTFNLSREPRLEPIERFLDAAGSASSRVALRDVGEEFRLS